jgi:hypothetical protein
MLDWTDRKIFYQIVDGNFVFKCILKAASCNRTIAKRPAHVITPLFRRIKYLCEESPEMGGAYCC